MKIIFIICIFICVSCTSQPKIESTNEAKLVLNNRSEFSQNITEAYFLANLPQWANKSFAGRCTRRLPIKFLNFKNISNSYQLPIHDMLQLQHSINRKLYNVYESKRVRDLRGQDESYLFYNSYQLVLGQSYEVKTPFFSDINILWIDPYVKLGDDLLLEILKSDKFQSKPPVVLSHCMTTVELENLITSYQLNDIDIISVGADFMSIFDQNFDSMFQLNHQLNFIFPNKNITLFAPWISTEIFGYNNYYEWPLKK